jgi:V8-like Glu-specific endopeptidase
MRSILILLTLVSTNTHASIFGNDDRIDTKDASPFLQNLARSVPALIQKDRIRKLPDGSLKLEGPKLTKMGFCSDETFADERQIANCSASLIGKNKVLTAAHCFNDKNYTCDSYNVVFDYQRHEIPMTTDHIMDAKQVYSCKKIDYYKFDESIAGVDLAIIELDRDVEDRMPVELDLKTRLKINDPLLMIGYPLGISQKVVDDGIVTGIDKKNVSFKHTLDSFSVNSGGPIFSADGKQVGVLVRGTGANSEERNGEGCGRWHIDSGNGYSDSNDLSPLEKILRKWKL